MDGTEWLETYTFHHEGNKAERRAVMIEHLLHRLFNTKNYQKQTEAIEEFAKKILEYGW